MVLAFYGFWLLLIWAPSLEGLFGAADWMAAIVVAAILVAWNDRYGAVAWRLMRAVPVADATLQTRLAQMAARADVPQPPIGVVPMGGGVLANAVALPSVRQSRVLMTSTFIERFTHDEIVAISAHEIAHLEYYSGARIRRVYCQSLAIAIVGALIEPAARVFLPASQSWLFVGSSLWSCSRRYARARDRRTKP
jgi:Zn-dependent protease with chaperone function